MPLENFVRRLQDELKQLQQSGTAKGAEQVVASVTMPEGDRGPRFTLVGQGDRQFIRMNGNSYLGLSLRPEIIRAEEEAALAYGVGPGAVRFISGSYRPHVELEKKLAEFHGRSGCMITSAAYTSVLGVLVSLTTPETIIVSDELNHNCIINGMKLARPQEKIIFKHLDMANLEKAIEQSAGKCKSLIVVTDGVFSMRGDLAPLKEMAELCRRHNDRFPGDIVFVVDDSHGVGAFGATGRGTEEFTEAVGIDILIATLGKAFGVNGGYIVSHKDLIAYLREKNPFYIYTNPITPSEASAALKAVKLVDSDFGRELLTHLRKMTARFEQGLLKLGYETIPSKHPIVPLMVRDTERTTRMVKFLRQNGVLATGLNYPVVPHGDQLIRFQVSADHTPSDIDTVLDVLRQFKESAD